MQTSLLPFFFVKITKRGGWKWEGGGGGAGEGRGRGRGGEGEGQGQGLGVAQGAGPETEKIYLCIKNFGLLRIFFKLSTLAESHSDKKIKHLFHIFFCCIGKF
jgi:hypothetical protein